MENVMRGLIGADAGVWVIGRAMPIVGMVTDVDGVAGTVTVDVVSSDASTNATFVSLSAITHAQRVTR